MRQPLETALRTEFPDRDIHVIGGDCNQRIIEGLDWLRSQGTARWGPQLGPVFALLDPDSMELEWSTIETIAQWTGQAAPSDYSRQGRLVELLVLFPTGGFRRSMPIRPAPLRHRKRRRPKWTACSAITMETDLRRATFGRHRRRRLLVVVRPPVPSGLLNLGYKYTSAIEVRNTSSVIQYHLVFATVNNTGRKVMRDVQSRAREDPAGDGRGGEASDEPAAPGSLRRTSRSDRYAEDPDVGLTLHRRGSAAFDPDDTLVHLTRRNHNDSLIQRLFN